MFGRATIRLGIGPHSSSYLIYMWHVMSYKIACVCTVYRLVLRVMCTLLGFVVVQDHLKRRDSRSQILVANYTSTMDRLAVELVFPCIMVRCLKTL